MTCEILVHFTMDYLDQYVGFCNQGACNISDILCLVTCNK